MQNKKYGTCTTCGKITPREELTANGGRCIHCNAEHCYVSPKVVTVKTWCALVDLMREDVLIATCDDPSWPDGNAREMVKAYRRHHKATTGQAWGVRFIGDWDALDEPAA